MLITISTILVSIALSVLSSLFVWKVEFWYDFYKPILIFIAGYALMIALWYILVWLFGRFVNKDVHKKHVSRWSHFWLVEGCRFLQIHCTIFIKVTGKYKLPKTKYLLVCNHRSNFDPMTLIPALSKEKISFVTKKSNYKIPLFTSFMKGMNFLPVDREDHLQSLEMFKRGTELIQQGISSVCVYPEGTRQLNEIMGPFHEGVFNIAMHARCPIVIATIKGAEMVHKNCFRRPTKVQIDILGVYQYDDYRAMTAKALSDKIHRIMSEHLDRIDVLEYLNK